MADVTFRPVEAGDLQALTDIYNHYVRETSVTFDIEPRTLEQRRQWLDGFAATGRYRCFVAVKDGSPLGWASSHRYHERAAYDSTVLTSVYLAPDMTRQGLGRKLYATLFGALEKEDVHRAIGSITVPNDASLGLHRATGFQQVGIYREVGRKFGRYWDVATWLRPMGIRP
jgi:phosphinothricin acetyltransferase